MNCQLFYHLHCLHKLRYLLMKYRKLGKYGIKVSEVSLGTWLTFGFGIEHSDAKKITKSACDNGINFFDTADVYNKGGAEKTLGKVLFDELGIRRQDIVIGTKCYFPISENVNDQGLSRKHIFESVTGSLQRLKTDYIDIHQCHRYDVNTPLEETCRAFNDLILQGKILYWGTSEWTAEQIENAVLLCDNLSLHKPVSNQPQYNIIQPRIETNGVIDICRKYGLGQVVWSPLAQGILTGKYSEGIPEDSRAASEKMNWFLKDRIEKDVIEQSRRYKELAEQNNVTPAQLALAWCLRNDNISSVITGASKKKQVIENCKAVEIVISPEIEKKIREIFPLSPAPLEKE